MLNVDVIGDECMYVLMVIWWWIGESYRWYCWLNMMMIVNVVKLYMQTC